MGGGVPHVACTHRCASDPPTPPAFPPKTPSPLSHTHTRTQNKHKHKTSRTRCLWMRCRASAAASACASAPPPSRWRSPSTAARAPCRRCVRVLWEGPAVPGRQPRGFHCPLCARSPLPALVSNPPSRTAHPEHFSLPSIPPRPRWRTRSRCRSPSRRAPWIASGAAGEGCKRGGGGGGIV